MQDQVMRDPGHLQVTYSPDILLGILDVKDVVENFYVWMQDMFFM